MTLVFEWTVKYVSQEIEVWKDDKKTSKVVVCLEEIGDAEYPNKLAVDFIGKKLDLLSWMNLKEWDQVKVNFNTFYNRYDRTDWTLSIFNSIRWWKIEKIWASTPWASDEDLPF
jgi:hypothetical protein